MNTQIDGIKSRALEGMRSYMHSCLEDGEDPGYTEDDVLGCQDIIDGLLKSLAEAPRGDAPVILGAVKEAVLSLNALNEKCDYGLIETDQREDLAMLIIKAAAAAGIGDGHDDITEEWREW